MVSSTPFLPQIYYFPPGLAGSGATLDAHFARCAEMGFDHVMTSAASFEGREDAIGAWVHACKEKRLKLLIGFDAGDARSARSDWFHAEPAANDLPDPRCSPRKACVNKIRFDMPEIADEVLIYWQNRLFAWIKAGVAGFCCSGIDQPPVSFWNRLIEAVKAQDASLRVLAWTPGSNPERIAALKESGFDAVFSSAAWWDYRSRWVTEEYARLSLIAPPIAFPDSPYEAVIANTPGCEDPSVRRKVYERALRLAASIGNGLLVPMGFEYGLTGIAGLAPEEFRAACSNPLFDLSEDIARANAQVAASAALYGAELKMLSGGTDGAAILLRAGANPRASEKALLIAVNPEATQSCAVSSRRLMERAGGYIASGAAWRDESEVAEAEECITLQPGGLQVFEAARPPCIVAPTSRSKFAISSATNAPRIAIEAVTPSVDGGRFAVKRTVGESIVIEADVFMDGHDKMAVALQWRPADEPQWRETRMHRLGNDRWCARLPLTRTGRWLFAVEAWHDAFATYRDELEKKSAAGLDVSLELEEGKQLVENAVHHAEELGVKEAVTALKTIMKSLKGSRSVDKAAKNTERIAALLSEPALEAMRMADARPFAVRSETMSIDAERSAARFSSWYELFPRSQSGDPKRHGTFDDVIARLPAIRAMGFDTLYFPPIHPIGKKNRKGRNNSLTPSVDDPGSPYAIGSKEGGHDAIHPQLGTIEDFRRLRDEAANHGLELALDFAIQCSPDHPWLKEHPEWFDWRPDGTIRYAENPPKKYEDIVNVDFYAEGSMPSLWVALRDVVLFWVKEGVRVFRVDNPHTKPLPFWEWMMADVKSRHPDVIFLSEAFTRPKVMYRLAKIGFTQSYTYFTWRHTKAEFIEYMTQLTSPPVRDFFRPQFFVNTPDINPPFLQKSGRPGFLIRAALATMLSGLWGMYSGFELCEATPVPGKEEYLDSEKYEIRAWDWDRPGNIVEEITQLNRIRRENPALQSHLGLRFLPVSNDNILCFLKATPSFDDAPRFGDNVVLIAINLDPFKAEAGDIELPLSEFGLPDDGVLQTFDLLTGMPATWQGKLRHVRLDPFTLPYAIWRIGG